MKVLGNIWHIHTKKLPQDVGYNDIATYTHFGMAMCIWLVWLSFRGLLTYILHNMNYLGNIWSIHTKETFPIPFSSIIKFGLHWYGYIQTLLWLCVYDYYDFHSGGSLHTACIIWTIWAIFDAPKLHQQLLPLLPGVDGQQGVQGQLKQGQHHPASKGDGAVHILYLCFRGFSVSYTISRWYLLSMNKKTTLVSFE